MTVSVGGRKNEHEGIGRIWVPAYGLDRRPSDQEEAAGALTVFPPEGQDGQYCRCDPGADRHPTTWSAHLIG